MEILSKLSPEEKAASRQATASFLAGTFQAGADAVRGIMDLPNAPEHVRELRTAIRAAVMERAIYANSLAELGRHEESAHWLLRANEESVIKDMVTQAASDFADDWKADPSFELGKVAGSIALGFLSKAAVGRFLGALRKIPCNSFVPGTLVLTEDGPKPIEDVRVGDLVWSRGDDGVGEGWKRVAAIIVSEDKPTLVITVVDDTGREFSIRPTAGHLFAVVGRGWVRADQLAWGDTFYSSDGGWLRLAGVASGATSRVVYNLEIEDFHTYFLFPSGAWVHNECDPSLIRHADRLRMNHFGPVKVNPRAAEMLEKVVKRFETRHVRVGKVDVTLDRDGMRHILSRHHKTFWGGDSAEPLLKAQQSFIPDGMSPDDVATTAIQAIKQVGDGVKKTGQWQVTIGGQKWQVGLNNGALRQLVPIYD